MLRGFREFLFRGNIVDLAVAVVIGAAFGAVVTAFARDVIGGIIGVVGSTESFQDAGFDVAGGRVVLGSTITALINFAIVAGVVSFVFLVPMRTLEERRGTPDEPTPGPAPSDEALLLAEIRDLLRAERR